MKIFITGATGFIGSRLVKRLAQTKHEMICLARESSDVQFLITAGVTVFIGDVTDKASLLQGMEGCDWVVNLANFYEFWTPDRRLYHDVNVKGTRNVMEAALAKKVSKVLHVSTAAVFGNAGWPVTEASELGARCFGEYAKTKREGDLITWELFEKKGLPLVVVYPGAVSGRTIPKRPDAISGMCSRERCRFRFSPEACFRLYTFGMLPKLLSMGWRRRTISVRNI